MTADNTLFLRRVLGLDAVASGATGLLLAFGSGLLADWLEIQAGFVQPSGVFLIAWALGVGALASRPRPSRLLVMGVIAINLLWTVESAAVLIGGALQPNPFGIAFVIAQAAAVAGFAALQAWGLRIARRTA
jgi:hypothetical protein